MADLSLTATTESALQTSSDTIVLQLADAVKAHDDAMMNPALQR